jgi:periplasmic copper chaperone A
MRMSDYSPKMSDLQNLARAAAALALLVMASCQRPQQQIHGLRFSNWYIALPIGNSTMSVAYGTIENDRPTERHLVAVAFSCADSAELHETLATEGRVAMHRLDSVVIPAEGTIAFAPGHKHVMLFGLKTGAECRVNFVIGADEAGFSLPIKARE